MGLIPLGTEFIMMSFKWAILRNSKKGVNQISIEEILTLFKITSQILKKIELRIKNESCH